MIAVADASPVCYPVPIGEIVILPKLFSQVIVPPAVIAEPLHEDAPKPVRDWATEPPPWVSIQDSLVGSTAGMEKLRAGEKAAILLAKPIHADVIVLDEKSARCIATGRGLPITGTLGILSEAAARRLVHLTTAIDRLSATNFRCSPRRCRRRLSTAFGDATNSVGSVCLPRRQIWMRTARLTDRLNCPDLG